MRGLVWNIIGIGMVVLFVRAVDWSLWVSVPVGLFASAIIVLLMSILVAVVRNM